MSEQTQETPAPDHTNEDTGGKGNEPAPETPDEGSDTGQLNPDGSHKSSTEGPPVGGSGK